MGKHIAFAPDRETQYPALPVVRPL